MISKTLLGLMLCGFAYFIKRKKLWFKALAVSAAPGVTLVGQPPPNSILLLFVSVVDPASGFVSLENRVSQQ